MFDRAKDNTVIDEVLEMVELRDRADDRVADYSQGMRQRLGIASCLIRRPRLLMLDEPANGVDPAGIRYLRELVRRLADQGITVFLSSHLLSEVQEVCGRVAVLNRGRVVHESSMSELHAGAAPRYRLQTTDLARAAGVCARVPGLQDLRVDDDGLSFSSEGETGLVAVTQALGDARVGIVSLAGEQVTLEGLFFSLTEPPGEQVRTRGSRSR